VIRTGSLADLPVITQIRTSVAENHLSVAQMEAIGITHRTIGEAMTRGDLGCWVAEDNGDPVGFAMAERKQAEIFALFVRPAQEGNGYGSALLAACEAWLKLQGVSTARLTTGEGTRAFTFYQRHGWRPTGEAAGHFATDAVLSKQL
jgi:GNAT superfamily N-acetyltransferase